MRVKLKQRNHLNKWRQSIILTKIQPHVFVDNISQQDSKQVFHKISQAYDTLSDPSKRLIYDQKQSFINKPKQQYSFNQPSFYFYKSASFSSGFANQYHKFYSDYEKKKSAQARFDQRARQQRQSFRNQQNQKNKYKSSQSQNSYNYSFNNKSFNQKTNHNNGFQQANKQNKPKQPNSFKSQKFTYKPTQNKQYEQIRRANERKAHLQKQKEKTRKNFKVFFFLLAILGFWIFLNQYSQSMRGPPVYSMYQSQNHKILKFTKQLNSPFYVTEDYIKRAQADDKFREYLDRKIDITYIKSLSRVCNTLKNKQQELYNNLDAVKSKKSRQFINDQIQNLDLSACDKLYNARQANPIYFKQLFKDGSSKFQM